MNENTNYTERIISLNSQILTQATTIGALEKTVSVLQDELATTKKKLDDDIPEVRVIAGDPTPKRVCARCGTQHNRTYCPNCDSSSVKSQPMGYSSIVYKNFDDAKRTIIEAETAKLTAEKLAAESTIAELAAKLIEKKKSYDSSVEALAENYREDAKHIQEQYKSELKTAKDTITDLNIRIEELQAGIVTEEIEDARKQELIMLRAEVERLTNKLNNFLEMPLWKQWFYARKQRNLEVEAIAEHHMSVDAIQNAARDIANNYWSLPSWMEGWRNVLYKVMRNFETGKVNRKNRK